MEEVKLSLYVENTQQFPTGPIKPGVKTGRTLAWSSGDCVLVWRVRPCGFRPDTGPC